VWDRKEERRPRAFCRASSSTSKCIGEGIGDEAGEDHRGRFGEMGLVRTASAIGGAGDGDREGADGGSGRVGRSRTGEVGQMMTTALTGGGGGGGRGEGGNGEDAASSKMRDAGWMGAGVGDFGAGGSAWNSLGGSEVAGGTTGENGLTGAEMTLSAEAGGLLMDAARFEMRGFRLNAFGGAGCTFWIILTGAGTGAGTGFGTGFGFGGSEVCLLCRGVYVRVGVGVSLTRLGGIAVGGIEPRLNLFVLCTTGLDATGTAASLMRLIIMPSFFSSLFLSTGVSRPVFFRSNGFAPGVCARAITVILCTPGSSIWLFSSLKCFTQYRLLVFSLMRSPNSGHLMPW
jgi:hypothetical protein